MCTTRFFRSLSADPAIVGSSDRFFVDAFIHTGDADRINISAVAVNGAVYSFTNVELTDGSLDSTQDESESIMIDVANIAGSIYKDSRFHPNTRVGTFCFIFLL